MANEQAEVQPTPGEAVPVTQDTPSKPAGEEAAKEATKGLFDNPIFNTMVEGLVEQQFGIVQEKEAEPKAEEGEKAVEAAEKAGEAKVGEGEETAEGWQERYQHAQKKIGQQGNEIGELRATVERLNKKLDEFTQQKQSETPAKKPYWEVIMEAREDDLAGMLSETYGREQDPETLKSEARYLKLAAKMANDMVSYKIKPFMELASKQEADLAYQKKETEFIKNHPDFEARRPFMAAFISKAYPEGVSSDKHFDVAHLAYVAVEHLVEKARTDAEALRRGVVDQHKAANSSVGSAGVKTKPPAAPEQKKSPYEETIERAFNAR